MVIHLVMSTETLKGVKMVIEMVVMLMERYSVMSKVLLKAKTMELLMVMMLTVKYLENLKVDV